MLKKRVIISAPVSSGGLYAHLRNAFPRLMRLMPEVSFEVYSPPHVLDTIFGHHSAPWMRLLPDSGFAGRLRWEFFDLPALMRRRSSDLLFAPFGPLLNLSLAPRALVKCENLLPLLEPNEREVSPADVHRHNMLRHVFVANARKAKKVICASRHARARLARLASVSAEKIGVVPHGVEIPPDEDRIPEETIRTLVQKPFMLHVGQAVPYRRTDAVLAAYQKLLAFRPSAPPLVWVGSARAADRAFEEVCLSIARPLIQSGKVLHLGHLPNADVLYLTKRAEIVLYPSVHEDCPNTVLEALGAGAPLVCGDIEAVREIAEEDAACFVLNPRPDNLCEAVMRLLDAPEERARLRLRARTTAARFSWDRTAEQIAAAIRDLNGYTRV